MGNGIVEFIKYLFGCTIKLLYPPDDCCLICTKMLEDEEGLCNECMAGVKKSSICDTLHKNGTDLKIYCSAYYSKIIKELILRLKYQGSFEAGEVLGRLLEETVKESKLQFDAITFVPSGRAALKKRGYNQSEFLAKELGKRINKKVISCLAKRKETKDQIGLDSEKRWQNLMNCFTTLKDNGIKDKRLLLIDDVFTTGATAFYCSAALKSCGCKEVIVLTVAKSRL